MWHIHYEYILDWLDSLDEETVADIFAAFLVLEEIGPCLGRPYVDSIKGSKIKNLKELRPGSSEDTCIRILFVFDYERKAVMLFGGDKSEGKGNREKWSNWYKKAIRNAEETYKWHLMQKEE